MIYLDLAEIPALRKAGVLSTGRTCAASFLRTDHFGGARQPLAESIGELVQRETGISLDGPIRLLTQLRTFGYYFSPLNLFYCFAADGRSVRAVVAEVQNTPWLERHCYVLWHGNRVGSQEQAIFRHAKAFHVSPFLSMDLEYEWRLTQPAERLHVTIENQAAGDALFRASLSLNRVPLSRRTQSALRGRYPLATLRINAAIYFQAFQLWRKQCPFFPHPKHLAGASGSAQVVGP